jgi:hypothetical protein
MKWDIVFSNWRREKRRRHLAVARSEEMLVNRMLVKPFSFLISE